MHIKDEAETVKVKWQYNSSMYWDTQTHTMGFIPRLLESDISMALSGVSMAILCTEMKRGDPRLGPGLQQGQIYISSRAVKAPPLSAPLRSCFSITVCASQAPSQPPPPLHPPLPKKTLLPRPLCAASSHNPPTVTHAVFSDVKLLCSLSYLSLLIPKLPCWHFFFYFFLSFCLFSFLFFFSQQEESCLSPPRLPLIHPTQSFAIFLPKKKKKKITSTSMIPLKECKTKKHIWGV